MTVIDHPLHPYTRGLIGSVPSQNRRGRPLAQIPGMAPSLLRPPAGCAFRPRCPRASERCLAAARDHASRCPAGRCAASTPISRR